MLTNKMHFLCFNLVLLVFYMFRTFCVHHQEIYTVHITLYVMFHMRFIMQAVYQVEECARYIYIYIYTGCPRNVPDFGRVFLMLTYTDITQNTYVQS